MAEEFPRRKVRYVIEGSLDDGDWTEFAPNAGDDELQARQTFAMWRAQRDITESSFRYRLLRRTVTDDLLLSEETARCLDEPGEIMTFRTTDQPGG